MVWYVLDALQNNFAALEQYLASYVRSVALIARELSAPPSRVASRQPRRSAVIRARPRRSAGIRGTLAPPRARADGRIHSLALRARNIAARDRRSFERASPPNAARSLVDTRERLLLHEVLGAIGHPDLTDDRGFVTTTNHPRANGPRGTRRSKCRPRDATSRVVRTDSGCYRNP
jgi:hypothetical protein